MREPLPNKWDANCPHHHVQLEYWPVNEDDGPESFVDLLCPEGCQFDLDTESGMVMEWMENMDHEEVTLEPR